MRDFSAALVDVNSRHLGREPGFEIKTCLRANARKRWFWHGKVSASVPHWHAKKKSSAANRFKTVCFSCASAIKKGTEGEMILVYIVAFAPLKKENKNMIVILHSLFSRIDTISRACKQVTE